MRDVTLSNHRPVQHLEVSSSAWFYMNHLHAPWDTGAHDHNFLEIAFMMKGGARHFVVQGEERCRAGDVYIIPIGAWHAYREGRRLELYNCLLSPALLENELAWMKTDPVFRVLFGLDRPRTFARVRKLHIPARKRARLATFLRDLELAHEREESRVAQLGRLLLVLDFLRETSGAEDAEETASHPAVREAVELLHQNLAEEWTLGKLASRLRLNPSYVVRLFRGETNTTPMKFLARIRAERAAALLLSGHRRIGEVGLAVGWPEPKLFATNFQRHFGLSASAYKRKMAASVAKLN